MTAAAEHRPGVAVRAARYLRLLALAVWVTAFVLALAGIALAAALVAAVGFVGWYALSPAVRKRYRTELHKGQSPLTVLRQPDDRPIAS